MVYQDLSLCDTVDVAGNLLLGREPVRHVLGLPIPKLGKHAQARSLRRRWRLKSRCTTRPTLGDTGFDPRDRSALPRSGECARFMGGSSIRKNRQFLGKPAGTWYSFQESPTSSACSCHKRRVTRTSA